MPRKSFVRTLLAIVAFLGTQLLFPCIVVALPDASSVTTDSLSPLPPPAISEVAQNAIATSPSVNVSEAFDEATRAERKLVSERLTGGQAPATTEPLVIAPSALRNRTNYATPIAALQPLGDEPPEAIGDGRDALPQDWSADENDVSLSEDEMLRLSGREGDIQAYAPAPLSGAPARPLALEELLAANRSKTPVYYKNAVLDHGVSQFSGPLESALPKEDFRLESANYMDYDSENDLLYGSGGVVVRYGPYELSADNMIFNTATRELQAAGNVTITNDMTFVSCESLRFDANTNHGVAYGVRGRTGTLYFLGRPEEDGRFTFRQLSKEESLMHNAAITTCDFPKPHLRVQAKEFAVIDEDRILANNAVLYAGDVPIMWLPFFTWSLASGCPWGGTVDLDSENGLTLRGWYHYYNEYETPDPLDDSKRIKVADTHARLFADWMMNRGRGVGLDYSYSFYDGKTRGDLNLYQFHDTERSINGSKQQSRYFYNGWNRTQLTKHTDWVASYFYPSDPDIFYDILDRYRSGNDPKYERIMERKADIGTESTFDNLFIGFHTSFVDRIGRNRTTNYQEPGSDDRDFDRGYNSEKYYESMGGTLINPYAGIYYDPLSYPSSLDKGIDSNRYGRVSEKYEANVSTNRIKLSSLPFWYTGNLNIFHNLDKGLNTVSTVDDSFVNGFDLYQSLTNQIRMGNQTTLVTRAGLGVTVSEREKDSFGLVPDGALFKPYYITGGEWVNGRLDGVRWIDKDTILVGTDGISLKDVKREYAYVDLKSKLTSRLTNSVTAYLEGRVRETTGDSLGDFYKKLGARKATDDLYNYKTDEHWVEAGLLFRSIIPRLNAQLSTGRNIESSSKHDPNEVLGRTDLRMNWTNRIRTVSLSAGTAYNETQVRAHSDPFQFCQKSLEYSFSGRLNSRRKNMYARTSCVFINNQNVDPYTAPGYTSTSSRDLDSRNESIVSVGVGREIGRKYLIEYTNNYYTRDSGDTEQFVTVSRDFHDVIASLGVGITSGELSSKSEDAKDTWQVRFNMKFKKAADMGLLPFTRSTSIYSEKGLQAFESGI